MKTMLECDTCTESTTGIQSAIAHVTTNPGHSMSGQDAEGTTTRVSVDFHDEDDEDDEESWDTGCATCDGGGCGDCA